MKRLVAPFPGREATGSPQRAWSRQVAQAHRNMWPSKRSCGCQQQLKIRQLCYCEALCPSIFGIIRQNTSPPLLYGLRHYPDGDGY